MLKCIFLKMIWKRRVEVVTKNARRSCLNDAVRLSECALWVRRPVVVLVPRTHELGG